MPELMPEPPTTLAPSRRTPWVFRNRSLLMALVFAVSALVGETLGRLPFFASWVGVVSLPSNLLLYGDRPGMGPFWPLAIPIVLGAVGCSLRFWGTSYLRGHIMADRHMHSDRLIIAGPFR